MRKQLLKALLIGSLITVGAVAPQAQVALENASVRKAATTVDEQLQEIYDNLRLNFDTANVVTDIRLPTLPMYGCTITWASDNEDNAAIGIEGNDNYVTIIRPSVGSAPINVTLTATIAIGRGESRKTKEKIFTITILPLKSAAVVQESAIRENFDAYDVGDDLSDYASWDLSGGEPCAKIVDKVPNNELVNGHKAVAISSTKTAKTSTYVRSFKLGGTVTMEGYFMYTGSLNLITIETGIGSANGPTIGIKDGKYYFYRNGNVAINNIEGPAEGVWTKFRIDVKTAAMSYTVSVYDYATQGLVSLGSSNYFDTFSNKDLTSFRLTVEGGANEGTLYLSDLIVDKTDNVPVAVTNPNRTDGIGLVEGYKSDVLYIEGDPVNYEPDFVVHNRFDPSEIYVEGDDYTVNSSEKIEGEIKTVTYTITLKSTGEVRIITQTIFTSAANAAPRIDRFKVSHLQTNEDSTSYMVRVTGNITRADSTLHYVLTPSNVTTADVNSIIAGTVEGAVTKGSVEQSERAINLAIDGLSINNSYNFFLVASNSNGNSQIYSKLDITEVINITTCEDFYLMRTDVTTLTHSFKLMNDLDFSNYSWVSTTAVNRFLGEFDGQGYTIKNLTINSMYRKEGIFQEVGEDAIIENLNIENMIVNGFYDCGLIAGFSYGCTIRNIAISNSAVRWNDGPGAEGYQSGLIGRIDKDTTNVENVNIDGLEVYSNKYSGIIAGNIKAGTVLNVKNLYCDATMKSDGARLGLVGRARGTVNMENVVCYLDIKDAKKEVGLAAGGVEETGIINAKNLVGRLQIDLITQTSDWNNFIGVISSTNSKPYSYSNVGFFDVDRTNISEDTITNNKASRNVGKTLIEPSTYTEEWWEMNTFLLFDTMDMWAYDEATGRPYVDSNKKADPSASDFTTVVSKITDDITDTNHYYIYKAEKIYAILSAEEKSSVASAYETLTAKKAQYESFLDQLNGVINGGGF